MSEQVSYGCRYVRGGIPITYYKNINQVETCEISRYLTPWGRATGLRSKLQKDLLHWKNNGKKSETYFSYNMPTFPFVAHLQ